MMHRNRKIQKTYRRINKGNHKLRIALRYSSKTAVKISSWKRITENFSGPKTEIDYKPIIEIGRSAKAGGGGEHRPGNKLSQIKRLSQIKGNNICRKYKIAKGNNKNGK